MKVAKTSDDNTDPLKPRAPGGIEKVFQAARGQPLVQLQPDDAATGETMHLVFIFFYY
jgi:hypothetical protein